MGSSCDMTLGLRQHMTHTPAIKYQNLKDAIAFTYAEPLLCSYQLDGTKQILETHFTCFVHINLHVRFSFHTPYILLINAATIGNDSNPVMLLVSSSKTNDTATESFGLGKPRSRAKSSMRL